MLNNSFITVQHEGQDQIYTFYYSGIIKPWPGQFVVCSTIKGRAIGTVVGIDVIPTNCAYIRRCGPAKAKDLASAGYVPVEKDSSGNYWWSLVDEIN